MHPSTHRASTHTEGFASSDRQPTTELIVDAQHGMRAAGEELLVRSLPAFQRWASRHLPSGARDEMDTCDLVQKVALQALRRLDDFRPEHAGSMPAYLRKVAKSRVCDEFRRVRRHPPAVALVPTVPSPHRSPLEIAIDAQQQAYYRAALRALRMKDRRLLIARNHGGWTWARVARHFALPSDDAARMAVTRAQRRLVDQLACRVNSSE